MNKKKSCLDEQETNNLNTANRPEFPPENNPTTEAYSLGVSRIAESLNNPKKLNVPVYKYRNLIRPSYNPKNKSKKEPLEVLEPIYNFSIETKKRFKRDESTQEKKEPAKAFRNDLKARDKGNVLDKTIIVLEGSKEHPEWITHAHLITVTKDIQGVRDLLKKYAPPRINEYAPKGQKKQNNAIEISETYEERIKIKGEDLVFEIDFDQLGYPPKEYLKPEDINQNNEYWINARYIEPQDNEPAQLVRRLPVNAGSGFYISKQLTTKQRVEERYSYMNF